MIPNEGRFSENLLRTGMNVIVPEYRGQSGTLSSVAMTVHTPKPLNFGRYLTFIEAIKRDAYFKRKSVSQLCHS